MRVPLSWLREYVDLDLEPEKLAERLTLLGMEVQAVERRGEDWRSVVIGELLEIAPHPNTDRLWLTNVATGDGRPVLSIVCGATNIAVGQRVPVALPGAVLPGDRTIEVTRIAGAESQGMLCSGDELRLTNDAEGILILPQETPLGRPLSELYGDVVLDVDVKPNRGDALSLIGLAREVSAATGAPLRWPDVTPPESGDSAAEHVEVEVRERELCPRFVARYLDGVRVGESPLDVQLRLTAAGTRPVSNVVDATNYVMLEIGKPTHAFDAARVSGGRIVVRLPEPGERLETLDHVQRELTPETLVIADEKGPLAIAGVMGGAASEVSEGTTSVILESAIFDPVSIRQTGQRYGLRSEASLRFEKGQEWRLARLGADRVAQLVAVWAGARVATGAVDTNPVEEQPRRLVFRPARVSRLLGERIDADQMTGALARVGIVTEHVQREDHLVIVPGEERPVDAEETSTALVAIVPTHRQDLAIEADVAEEIARVRGYETIPAQLPETPMPHYRPDPRRLVDSVRDLLAGRGLTEVVSHALVGPEDHARFGVAPDDRSTIRVTNPVSPSHSELRRSLLPGLLRVLAHNERQRRADLALFEAGPVHRFDGGEPVESSQLAIVLAGAWELPSWNRDGRAADIWDAKGVLDGLVERLGARLAYEPLPPPSIAHPVRVAAVSSDGTDGRVALGVVGELDPRYLQAVGLRADRVAFATLDLDALASALPTEVRVSPPPRVPAVERDVAVVVERSRPATQVEAVIRERAGDLLRDLRLFDRYEGPPLSDAELSLAYRLRLQAGDRTLTDAEVDGVIARVVEGLAQALGARLRA